MSRARYFISIALAIVFSVGMFIIFKDTFAKDEIVIRILISILIGTFVGELVFWTDGFPVRAGLFFLNICKIIFLFWLSFFIDGSILIFILGIALSSFLWTAIGAVFSFAVGVFIILAPVFYIIHLITFPSDFDY